VLKSRIFENPRWWTTTILDFDLGHNFGVDQYFRTKFGAEMENRQPKGTQYSKIRFSKIRNGGRLPSWISILGRNFGVAQHYCAKFGTLMEN